MGESLLTIGAFARRSRLSQKALRLYDRLGLLVPAEVDQDSGYRRYAAGQLDDARLIVMLRRLDMPLADVGQVLAAEDRAAVLDAYWARAERRFAGQRQLAGHLSLRLSGKEEAYSMYEIKTRDVPEQIVLTEQRHVRQSELPTWIPAAWRRLNQAAKEHGGQSGYDFVVYFGEVSDDGDGPAEVCVPIASSTGVPEGAAARVEPAHREAYTRVRKADIGQPQMQSAYEAVEQWIGGQGLKIAGACREVACVDDYDAAGPDDEVYDVVFVISA
ncbi:MerR family transcriptional regulator [Streptomyces sp. A7024]|uniref:MerR family transcriptional regulator n=1 Tax=Streptomyces coryli TaxID=1128680 RepID=A0A6G4TYJ6_9ACTN|nr:MerR family transcriptional regulator [Streptomyces coryli]NGN64964.1 MerR family transcriptional regulator [Streptomyces coryli]